MASIEITREKDNGFEVVFRHVTTKLTRLNEPEEFQNKLQFGAFLVVDPEDEGLKEFQEKCEALLERAIKSGKHKKENARRPWAADIRRTEAGYEETGHMAVKTKALADRKPEIPFIDPQGNPMRPETRPVLGDGSKINMACWVSISASTTFGATIAVWITAVQPIKVVEGGGGYGFGAEPDADYAGAQTGEAASNPF
jgi:hypothetical protein